VTAKQAVTLHAQIPVPSSATSVKSVTLTVTASVATTAKWTPPSAAESVSVTAPAIQGAKPSAKTSATPTPAAALPLGPTPNITPGPLPNLGSVSSSLINPGDASDLFPAIGPSGSSRGISSGIQYQKSRPKTEPVFASSALGFANPSLTGQLAGLIALACAVMLTVSTRLSLRRWFGSRKHSR
jgi:hypothetical protein